MTRGIARRAVPPDCCTMRVSSWASSRLAEAALACSSDLKKMSLPTVNALASSGRLS